MEEKCILGFDEVFEDGIICNSDEAVGYKMDDEEMASIVKEQIQLYYSKKDK